jgi:glycosyltransferase involved in cell wall biosynthesis
MRLLLVATISETLRGFFLPFARYFRSQGWTVGAAASGIEQCPDCCAAFNDVWDIDWSRNPLDLRNLITAPRRVREIVAAGGYDVVHVNTPVAAFVSRFALRRRAQGNRPALVYTAHGFHFHENGSPWRNALFLGLERTAASWTDFLVVMNRFDQQMAERYHLAGPDRVIYIPGIGVDRSVYSRADLPEGAAASVRRSFGLGEGSIFLMIGEFIPRKCHADAIAAMDLLRDTPAGLVMAGDGPLLEPMKQLAARRGLGNRVRFLGSRKDVPALLAASDALLLPSRHEGLPRAILEAMSVGVPSIGADIRGTRELLGSGAGLLVPPGDVQGLALAMRYVIDHRVEARAMGDAGKKQSADYDLDRVLCQYREVYNRAANRQNTEDAQCMAAR